ncbi:MAG: DUF1822 family protein [Roseofilum sp. SBFL]|uniref:DUF1822 family protein n=1 Tax=unclassified Roseofilum TaxID=2620099 RepID=UPI001B0062AC|nr:MULTISPECIES: DUF1822 family protein [unclassified Roseofilum]MBP0012254.1 DUF1822 family protein [Roseofilum sp. SID3]MBP0025048.1 DUF1822 family protein [Roseofilum sp. SID2]MBP0036768.1 DUF1822 family protein [Roseofilum sp. SID1]MBP0041710.1 DUF1822 family protein [Roseofilum sp. SBFL]
MVIHSSPFFNFISPKIPLGFSDYQQAEVFLQAQKNPRKRKQVYLNTLSVLAVKFHLQYLGFDPQTQACESFDSVLQACFDVADLELPWKLVGKGNPVRSNRWGDCPSVLAYILPCSSGKRVMTN